MKYLENRKRDESPSIKAVICTRVNRTLFWLVDRCISGQRREELVRFMEVSKENMPKAEFADKVMDVKEDIERAVERIKDEQELMMDVQMTLKEERDYYEDGLKRIAQGYLNQDGDLIRDVLIEYGFLRFINKEEEV